MNDTTQLVAEEAENVAMRMQEDGYIKQRDVRDVTVRIKTAIVEALKEQREYYGYILPFVRTKDRAAQSSEQRIHVIPVGDLDVHAAQATCWCNPTETESKLWVHNAKDCREAKERMTDEQCSEGWVNIREITP